MNKTKFYDSIRETFKLTSKNVEGFDFILDEALKRDTPINDLAYILATVWWETAHTMQPIEEYGKGKGRAYGSKHPVTGKTYYGRGYVQLTWYDNYLKAGAKLGVDLVHNPELTLRPEIAIRILFEGMYEGWFTGKSIRDFIDLIDEDYKEDLREFSNARRIINGTDKQVIIGQLAISFEGALRVSDYEGLVVSPPLIETPVRPPVAPVEPIPGDEELAITLTVNDLSNVTLLDFLNALNSLKHGAL